MKIKKPLFLLWALGVLATCSLIVYGFLTHRFPADISLLKMLIGSGLTALVFYGVIVVLCYFLLRKSDLQPFNTTSALKKILYPALLTGVGLGFFLALMNSILFRMPQEKAEPFFVSLLAAFYAAIDEEIVLRLFLLTLVYRFLQLFKRLKASRSFALWTATALVALLWGGWHTQALFRILSPSALLLSQTFLVHAIPSVLYGYLYWSRSFWTASLAHLIAEVTLRFLLF